MTKSIHPKPEGKIWGGTRVLKNNDLVTLGARKNRAPTFLAEAWVILHKSFRHPDPVTYQCE